jgi:hypothetical protein
MAHEKPKASRPEVGSRFVPHAQFTGIFVPEPVLRLDSITPGAKLCYGRLNRYAGKDGECWPSEATLGAELGMSERQARRYIHELETERLIEGERRPRGKSKRYFFLWHECMNPSTPPAQMVCDDRPQMAGLDRPQVAHQKRYDRPQMAAKDSQCLKQSSQDTQSVHSPRIAKTSDSAGEAAVSTVPQPQYEQMAPKDRPQPPKRVWAEADVTRIVDELCMYMAGTTEEQWSSKWEAKRIPDPAMARRILDHGWGASAQEIVALLRTLKAKQSPFSRTGPKKNWWWFVNAVSNKFRHRDSDVLAPIANGYDPYTPITEEPPF